jgi:plastocyanin
MFISVAMLWASVGLQSQVTSHTKTTMVRGRVEVIGTARRTKTKHGVIPETVVWLTPIMMTGANEKSNLGTQGPSINPAGSTAQNPRLVQKNKTFQPHILVVPAGSTVEFPNEDPFFHNVFSLFEGKRFDLGLYEAGTSRKVRFDRAGISYIFCNIHPDMSAVVITITTPLFAISNSEGQLGIASVPYGRYLLHVWSEGMGPEVEQPLISEITITENASSLGMIRVPPAKDEHIAHKNKYGRDYDQPTPDSSVYAPQQ